MNNKGRFLSVIISFVILTGCFGTNFSFASDLSADYVIASVSGADNYSKEIVVDFTEAVDYNAVSENVIILNTETGDDISCANVSLREEKIVITIQELLTANTEYCVILPNGIKGKSGKTVVSNMVYFVAGVSPQYIPEYDIELFETDFDDLSLGACANNDEWNTYMEAGNIEGISCVEATDNAGNAGRAIEFVEPGNWKPARFEANAVKRWATSIDYGKVIFEFDVSLPKIETTGNFNFTFNNPGTKTGSQFYIDGWGNIIINNKESGTTDRWNDSFTGGNNYPTTTVVHKANMQPDVWYNVLVLVDQIERTMAYYFDGTYIGTVKIANDANPSGIFKGMRLESIKPGVVIRIDNNKVGLPVQPATKTVTFRMIDENGVAYGPKAQNTSVVMKKAQIVFSDDIDISSVDANTLNITNGTDNVIWANPVFDKETNTLTIDIKSMLVKESTYNLIVDGITDDATNDFLVKYSSDFSTTAVGELALNDIVIYNSNGDVVNAVSDIAPNENITAKIDVLSTNDEPVTGLKASITSYANGVLCDTDVQSFDAKAMSPTEVDDLKINAGSLENSVITVLITDSNNVPLFEAYKLGSYTVEPSEWTLSYSGSANKSKKVYAEVKAPENNNKSIVYREQISTDDKGNFEIKFNLKDDHEIPNDAVSGFYTLTWTNEFGITDTVVKFFVNLNESKNANDSIVEIMEASTVDTKDADITSISNVIDKNRYALGIDLEEYESLDTNLIASLLYDYISKNNAFTNDTVYTSARIASVKSGNTNNLFDYSEVLLLNESRIKDFYKKYYVTDVMKEKITTSLRDKNYSTMDEFYSALTEEFVLKAIETPDGLDNVKELIKEFSTEIGTGKNGIDDAYKAVMNNTYSSYESLKSAFDKANVLDEEEDDKSLGGTRGSGGFGGVPSVTIDVPPLEQATNKQLHNDIFTDLDDATWAKDAIVFLAEKKIINGKENYKYYPNDIITREEACKIISLAFKLPVKDDNVSKFTDVSMWAQPYVEAAYACGIVNGYDEYVFGGRDSITRQDLAVMIYRAMKTYGYEFAEESNETFIDASQIASYANEAVTALYAKGYINGVGNGYFSPVSNASRAQIAQIVYNVIK